MSSVADIGLKFVVMPSPVSRPTRPGIRLRGQRDCPSVEEAQHRVQYSGHEISPNRRIRQCEQAPPTVFLESACWTKVSPPCDCGGTSSHIDDSSLSSLSMSNLSLAVPGPAESCPAAHHVQGQVWRARRSTQAAGHHVQQHVVRL